MIYSLLSKDIAAIDIKLIHLELFLAGDAPVLRLTGHGKDYVDYSREQVAVIIREYYKNEYRDYRRVQ